MDEPVTSCCLSERCQLSIPVVAGHRQDDAGPVSIALVDIGDQANAPAESTPPRQVRKAARWSTHSRSIRDAAVQSSAARAAAGVEPR